MADDFKERYYDVFGASYKFMRRHYNATIDAEWDAIVREIGQMQTDFENS